MRFRRVSARIAAVAASTLLLSACYPINLPGDGGGGGASCPQGTYTVTDQVLQPLATSLGNLQLTPLPGGTLTLTVGATTWTLAGSQSFDVSGSTRWGAVDGTASGTLDATGTYSKLSSTELSFTLGTVDGSGSFTGTVAGVPVNRTVTLDEIGLHAVYGLSGRATFACGAAPDLSLTFTRVVLHLHR
jgi:hypothetical protein